jgi:hypothetical protein
MTDYAVPPPELVAQWQDEWNAFALGARYPGATDTASYVAIRAAQWGADQELEACEQAIIDRKWFADPKFRLAELHNARRPKPPSLKEQALKAVNEMSDCMSAGFVPKRSDLDAIRRALEALPE